MKAATLLRRDSNTGVCEIFKNTFFHRTPTMAVSGLQKDFLTKKNHWKSFVLSSVYSKPILSKLQPTACNFFNIKLHHRWFEMFDYSCTADL